MECHGDDNTALPPTVLTHLILIVEASTIIIRASTLQADDPALKVYAQTYFTDFPRARMEIMSNADSSTLRFWCALNLSIAHCGCECFVGSNAADLDDVLTQFVQSEFDNLVQSDSSVRQVAQGLLLKGRLQAPTRQMVRGQLKGGVEHALGSETYHGGCQDEPAVAADGDRASLPQYSKSPCVTSHDQTNTSDGFTGVPIAKSPSITNVIMNMYALSAVV
ncbi:hypothetical protein DYB31_002307 [Aphanomyces astaci]|uniref:Uncharacterized protein n=1 Tax=Aphanomyces astaci TaxID=112090 RepID=A0A397EEX8_APHAT|nr:hypothetical protein DYB31_002307 [Aphanomyces astaci]